MKEEQIEITLSEKECIQVALYMLQEYEKDMEKPQILFYSFKQWLNKLNAPLTDDK